MEHPGILVIDDEPWVLDVMVETLNDAGYFTVATGDARAAIAALQNVQFEVVVSDVMMPHLTGLELLTTVKRQTPESEVILVTGYADCEVELQAWAAGAAGFLEKPVSADRLVGAVQRALEFARLRQQGRPA